MNYKFRIGLKMGTYTAIIFIPLGVYILTSDLIYTRYGII
jgi:hypothetical protein